MSLSALDYFKQHNLFDAQTLHKHCQEHHVKYIISPRFPDLVMLHYDRECQNKHLWSAFSRMCRGLIVNLVTKEITAHPFDKFYNLEEMPETKYANLVNYGSFEVVEKLDGSMLILFTDTNGTPHLTTKGSFDSDHAKHAEELHNPKTIPLELIRNYTLIFELISYKFPVVINYAIKGYNEGIYLIGARDKTSNKLLSYRELKALGAKYQFNTPNFYKFSTLDDIIAKAQVLPVLEEGFVLHFPATGLRVKIKGAEYLRAHRVVFNLTDKHVFEYLIRGEESVLLDALPEEYKKDIVTKIEGYKSAREKISRSCHLLFEQAPRSNRKEFAIWIKTNTPPELHSHMFQIYTKGKIDENKLFTIVAQAEGVSL